MNSPSKKVNRNIRPANRQQPVGDREPVVPRATQELRRSQISGRSRRRAIETF